MSKKGKENEQRAGDLGIHNNYCIKFLIPCILVYLKKITSLKYTERIIQIEAFQLNSYIFLTRTMDTMCMI